jgi:hypothetical protein
MLLPEQVRTLLKGCVNELVDGSSSGVSEIGPRPSCISETWQTIGLHRNGFRDPPEHFSGCFLTAQEHPTVSI